MLFAACALFLLVLWLICSDGWRGLGKREYLLRLLGLVYRTVIFPWNQECFSLLSLLLHINKPVFLSFVENLRGRNVKGLIGASGFCRSEQSSGHVV